MAQKRMFSLTVTGTDEFLDLPTSSQALYFHLGMHGDDDGFVASPKKIMRTCGCNLDDLRLLSTKGFVIPFDNGVVVIRDWRLNNTLKNDRYRPTIYQEEKAKLQVDSSGRYLLVDHAKENCFQLGSSLEPERNSTKQSRTEQRETEERYSADKPPRSRFSPPAYEDVAAYCAERGSKVDPQRWFDFYLSNGWKVGKNQMRDWKAAVRSWERNSIGGKSRGPNGIELAANDDRTLDGIL